MMMTTILTFVFIIFTQLRYYDGCFTAGGQQGFSYVSSGLNDAFGGTMGASPYSYWSPNVDPSTVTSTHDLNCYAINSCRWRNVADDQLDWGQSIGAPDPNKWAYIMGTDVYPDPSESFVLASRSRPVGDGGQLVSDPIGCMPAPLQVTLTYWCSLGISADPAQSPRIRVCSRNIGDTGELNNCAYASGYNGQPNTVIVPPPADPTSPAELLIIGENFITQEGGAIYLRDITVEGNVDMNCDYADTDELNNNVYGNSYGGSNVDRQTYAGSVDGGHLQPPPSYGNPIGQPQLSYGNPIGQPPPSYGNPIGQPPQSYGNSIGANGYSQPSGGVGLAIGSIPDPARNSVVFAACLSLSCNPSNPNCKWSTVTRNDQAFIPSDLVRISNPLTGVRLPPNGAKEFSVAAFDGSPTLVYRMASDLLTIPNDASGYYFCFHEFFATHGMVLLMCVDAGEQQCFYERARLETGDRLLTNRRWRRMCVPLPIGTYQVFITARYDQQSTAQFGNNIGDIGFVPHKITTDPYGENAIC